MRVVRLLRGAPLHFDRWFESNGMTIRTIGQREAGKSNSLELLALMAFRKGCAVIDISSARDSESMAVLLGPFPERVRMIVSDSCRMASSKVQLHTIPIGKFTLPEDGFWYVLPRVGFSSEASYLKAMKKIIQNLWSSDEWERPRWLLVREAQILLSSISRTTGSREQRESSDALQQLNSEARHHGLGIFLDSQREIEVSRSLRQISDVLVIKRLGEWIDFPEDMKFIFNEVEPAAFRYCPTSKAYVFTASGQLAFVDVGLVPFHHKRGKSIMSLLDISVEFDEDAERAQEVPEEEIDGRVAVNQSIHREIIRMRDAEGSSFDSIALRLGVASSTVKSHYKRHYFNLKNNLPCPNCSK